MAWSGPRFKTRNRLMTFALHAGAAVALSPFLCDAFAQDTPPLPEMPALPGEDDSVAPQKPPAIPALPSAPVKPATVKIPPPPPLAPAIKAPAKPVAPAVPSLPAPPAATNATPAVESKPAPAEKNASGHQLPPPPTAESDKVIEGIPAEMPTADDPLGIPELPDAPEVQNKDGTRKAPVDPNNYIEQDTDLTPEQREVEIQKLLKEYVGEQTDESKKLNRKFEIDFNKLKKLPDGKVVTSTGEVVKEGDKELIDKNGAKVEPATAAEEGEKPAKRDPRLEPERSRRHNYKTYVIPKAFRALEGRENAHIPTPLYAADLYEYLYAASYRGNLNGVRALLDKGVSPNQVAHNGFTPLMAAAQMDQLDAARLLLLAGADPNTQNQSGLSALHIAASSAGPTMVKALLHMGANPRITTHNGMAPLEMAQRSGRSDIVAILEQALPSAPLPPVSAQMQGVSVRPLVPPRPAPSAEPDYSLDNPLPFPPVPFTKPHMPVPGVRSVPNTRPVPDIVQAKPPVLSPGAVAMPPLARSVPRHVIQPPVASTPSMPQTFQPHIPTPTQPIPPTPRLVAPPVATPAPIAPVMIPRMPVAPYIEKQPLAKPVPFAASTTPLIPANRALPPAAYREVPVLKPYEQMSPAEQKLWQGRLDDWKEADRLFNTLTFEEKVEYNYRRKVLEQVYPEQFHATNATDQLLLDNYMKRWTDFDHELRLRVLSDQERGNAGSGQGNPGQPTAKQPLRVPAGNPNPKAAALYPAMAQLAFQNQDVAGTSADTGLSSGERLHEILANWRIIDSRFYAMDHDQKRRADEQRRQLLDLLVVNSVTGTYAKAFAHLPKPELDAFIASQSKWEAFEDSERLKYPDYAILVRPWGGEVTTDPLADSSADASRQYPSAVRTKFRLLESVKQAGK